MPISSIILQPASNSLNAAYRPIVFEVRATRTDADPQPPVVYCDIYTNSVFYKTISKSQPFAFNLTDTDWYFDIQDACQELLLKNISPNAGIDIVDVQGSFVSVMCKFRSSGFDSNGFIQTEDTTPIQVTGRSAAVSGTGTSSNSIFVLNAVLQHEDNQILTEHLSSFKTGTWESNSYPLSHRNDNYTVCKNDSDYFSIIII